MNKVLIRNATKNDVQAWSNLRFELWPDCPRERHCLEIEQLLAGLGTVATAWVQGGLVGFAEVSIRVDHVEGTSSVPVPYLEGWYVLTAYRHRGIGRALLAFIEEWSKERGYRELASDAEIDNETSQQLHAMLGFVEVGRTVHFVKSLSKETPHSSQEPKVIPNGS